MGRSAACRGQLGTSVKIASRQRRIRDGARWKRARAAARRRDGNRCRLCGSTQRLAVHHIFSLKDGGSEYALDNLVTLCSRCHGAQHRGGRGATENGALPPRNPDFRDTNSESHVFRRDRGSPETSSDRRQDSAWASVRECHPRALRSKVGRQTDEPSMHVARFHTGRPGCPGLPSFSPLAAR
jgi:hypothetical protein